MNILFVLENYYPHIGGVEIVFKNLAEGLVKLGHKVNVVTHQMKNSKSFELINGVKINRVACFHSRYWFTFLAIPKVIALAKEADIIHTTTYNGAFPARIGARVRGKPSVITIHEVLGKSWGKFGMGFVSAKLHEFLEFLIMRLKFDHFVSVSKSTEKAVLKSGISKSSFIYNGIDYNIFNPKKYSGKDVRKKIKSKFVYMFYGRPGISKGLEYLLMAVPKIAKEVPDSKLIAIVSKDKAYAKRYKLMLGLIKKLGIEKNVTFLDPVEYKKLPEYIKAADCVVVPSLTEGFGFTAAESCAMGKPVVASNTTSLPEVVSGKYILVKPKSPKSIAEAVVLVSKGKVKDKGKKIFKWSDSIKKYVDIYKKIK